jgi:hypothetical protein
MATPPRYLIPQQTKRIALAIIAIQTAADGAGQCVAKVALTDKQWIDVNSFNYLTKALYYPLSTKKTMVAKIIFFILFLIMLPPCPIKISTSTFIDNNDCYLLILNFTKF